MVGELAGHACDRRVRMKSAGATPVAHHCLPVLSGIRRRAALGPMPSPTLFERIPPAARDIARWPFFLRPTRGSAGYPLADGSGKTGGSLADRRCMLSGKRVPGCYTRYIRFWSEPSDCLLRIVSPVRHSRPKRVHTSMLVPKFGKHTLSRILDPKAPLSQTKSLILRSPPAIFSLYKVPYKASFLWKFVKARILNYIKPKTFFHAHHNSHHV